MLNKAEHEVMDFVAVHIFHFSHLIVIPTRSANLSFFPLPQGLLCLCVHTHVLNKLCKAIDVNL